MTESRIQILVIYLSLCITVGYSRAPKKIVNGEHAWEAEFPYQVSIQLNEEHICGGSIIDEQHIVTAAHCVVDENGKMNEGLEVLIGSIDKTKRTADNLYSVSKQLYHKEYNVKHHRENDIGILKLSRSIKFNPFQKSIDLPTQETPDSTEVFITGWGAHSYHGNTDDLQYPELLQKLSMTVINNTMCKRLLNNQKHFQVEITPTHMCASSNKTAGVCYGDSGGALIHKNTIIGIISTGVPCGKGFPDIFTRVYSFVSWIKWAVAQ